MHAVGFVCMVYHIIREGDTRARWREMGERIPHNDFLKTKLSLVGRSPRRYVNQRNGKIQVVQLLDNTGMFEKRYS